MAQTIRHASACKPRSIPVVADVTPDDWDRVQSFSPAISQPKEKVYEIGRLDHMDFDKDTLEATLSVNQLEYGTLASILQAAGLIANPASGVALSDYDDARTDFYLPGKDEYAGSVEQTLWLQKMSLDAFGLEISAEERLVRTFDFSGEYAKILREGNKYLIFKEDDAPSGTSGNYVIDLSDPAPVEDPNNSGVYILQIYRIRSGTATELSLTTDYTYNNGTKELTIISASAADNYRIWYSAASYGTSGDPTSLNDVDDYYLGAENVKVEIYDGTHTAVELTKLTSLTIGASLNRIEEAVIGATEKVLKDVESYDVTCSFDGFVKNSTIEEVLMAQAGQSWGIIDFTLLQAVSVSVKIYQENTKSTFLIGYKMTNLEFDDESQDYNANEFASNPINLSGSNLIVSTDETDITLA